MIYRIRNIHLSSETLGILTIILLGLFIRLYGLGWGLPDIYEEATPLKTAWKMWNWDRSMGIDPNPHFFNYPSFMIYLHFGLQALLFGLMKFRGAVGNAIDYQIKYIVDATPWYLLGRLVSTIFSLGTIVFTYLIGYRIGSRRIGLLAALFIALNAFFIERSQMIEVDVPLTFGAMFAIWAALRILHTPTLQNYIIAGLAVGSATAMKYTGAFLIIPVVYAHSVVMISGICTRKAMIRNLIATGIAAVLIFALSSPFIIIDFKSFYSDLLVEQEHMDVGHFGLGDDPSLMFYASALYHSLLGSVLTLSSIAGFVYFLIFRRRQESYVVIAFIIPYITTLSLWSMRADRYLLPILPLFVILAAGFIVWLSELNSMRSKFNSYRIAALVFLVLMVTGPQIYKHHNRIESYRNDPRLLAKNWIESNIPSGAWIVTERYGPELFQAATLLQVQPEARRPLMAALDERPIYPMQIMQMYQTNPERSAPFYDLRLYDIADFVITSSSVKSRYERDPKRFWKQIQFYRDLDENYEKVRVFHSDNQFGPIQTIYRNTVRRKPFGQRGTVTGPNRIDGNDRFILERLGSFYLHVGLNYEIYSYPSEALKSYNLALEYPTPTPITAMLVMRKTSCLSKLGRNNEIQPFLQNMILNTRDARLREFCQKILEIQMFTTRDDDH